MATEAAVTVPPGRQSPSQPQTESVDASPERSPEAGPHACAPGHQAPPVGQPYSQRRTPPGSAGSAQISGGVQSAAHSHGTRADEPSA